MGQYKMEVDLSKCVGCGVCAMACKLGNNTPNRDGGETFNWADIAVKTEGTATAMSTTWLAVPTLCNHCKTPKCVSVCPVAPDANGRKAIFKDAATGIVMYNNARCISCFKCRQHCPYSGSNADIVAGTAQYSVISVNYTAPHSNWDNTTALFADCTATPAQVQAGAGTKPPYRTAWSHSETVGGLPYVLENVRLKDKPEKCYYCYHRLKDTTLGATENNGERRPYCVLACPAEARNLKLDPVLPVDAKVLQQTSPKGNLELVAATNSFHHSTPQTYYIGQFSYRLP